MTACSLSGWVFRARAVNCQRQGLTIVTWDAAFWLASYFRFVPDTWVTVITDALVVLPKLLLLILQLPVLVVTQEADPPGKKLPLTVALGTTAPVLMSRMVTTTLARQFLPTLLAEPTSDLTATTELGASWGAPAASE